MEKSLQVFENVEFGTVRTLTIDNEPWFIGKDVASILGYSDTFGALKKHVDDADKQNCQNSSFESPRGLTIINESGLYSLILSSKLPTAKAFKRWVTSEVLPAIRKHGMYATPQTAMDLLQDPRRMAELLLQFADEKDRRMRLEEEARLNAPKVQFAEAVSDSDSCVPIGELAKLIKQNGIDIGRNRLFEYLRGNDYLCSVGESRNLPTQRAMEKGLFRVKENVYYTSDSDNAKICRTTMVTGKGLRYFIDLFLRDEKTA